MTLNTLKRGESARVVKLNNIGIERRRLLDLGILPGTLIEKISESPLGDPVAFRVRNAVIALRKEQSELIEIEPQKV